MDDDFLELRLLEEPIICDIGYYIILRYDAWEARVKIHEGDNLERLMSI